MEKYCKPTTTKDKQTYLDLLENPNQTQLTVTLTGRSGWTCCLNTISWT